MRSIVLQSGNWREGGGGGETDRQRLREKETKTHTERQTDRQTQTQADRQTEDKINTLLHKDKDLSTSQLFFLQICSW